MCGSTSNFFFQYQNIQIKYNLYYVQNHCYQGNQNRHGNKIQQNEVDTRQDYFLLLFFSDKFCRLFEFDHLSKHEFHANL